MRPLKNFGTKLWAGWMWFAEKVGWVNEHILLGVVYFVFIGIYAILFDFTRLFRKKPTTMWREFEHQPETLAALEKQF
jgi:hypothetical protein